MKRKDATPTRATLAAERRDVTPKRHIGAARPTTPKPAARGQPTAVPKLNMGALKAGDAA